MQIPGRASGHRLTTDEYAPALDEGERDEVIPAGPEPDHRSALPRPSAGGGRLWPSWRRHVVLLNDRIVMSIIDLASRRSARTEQLTCQTSLRGTLPRTPGDP